jgi:hypothetical protein
MTGILARRLAYLPRVVALGQLLHEVTLLGLPWLSELGARLSRLCVVRMGWPAGLTTVATWDWRWGRWGRLGYRDCRPGCDILLCTLLHLWMLSLRLKL